MDYTISQKRLSNKAHIFPLNAALCLRCGSSFADALETPLRCAGEATNSHRPEKPRTLTAAIDAEHPF
jgi:hypothetical protein